MHKPLILSINNLFCNLRHAAHFGSRAKQGHSMGPLGMHRQRDLDHGDNNSATHDEHTGGSQSSSGGTGGGGSPVAQFNVGEAAITIPAAPSGLPALEGPFDFDSATVMWKIEWKCSVTRWSKPRDGVYGYFWQFIGSHPHIYFGHNFISVAWTKATPTGKVNDYIRFYWAHTPDNNPHVYRYEWSAATGETCLSIDGLVNTDGKDRVCSTGRTLLNALDTRKPVTRLNQGKYEGENQNVQGKWYYTKVYIK